MERNGRKKTSTTIRNISNWNITVKCPCVMLENDRTCKQKTKNMNNLGNMFGKLAMTHVAGQGGELNSVYWNIWCVYVEIWRMYIYIFSDMVCIYIVYGYIYIYIYV